MNHYKVECFDSRDGARWRLVRAGEILATSEAYASRWSRNRTARALASALNAPMVSV